jgi:SanA protein
VTGPRLLCVGAGLTAAGAAGVAAANAVVLLRSGRVHDDPAQVPPAQVALVPGAGVSADGRPSALLADRLRAAAALYRHGRVDRVLVSGDHGRPEYDEVNPMRHELVHLGVPDDDIFTDHAGFDTWDSMVRARKVFEVKSAIVVTQRFHMARALWLGRHAGLRVDGVVAGRSGYGRDAHRLRVREVFARVKAVQDVITRDQPRLLGSPVPITGDAGLSRG